MSHICRTATIGDSRVGLKLWRLLAKGATRRGPSKRQPSSKGRAVMAGRGTASKATAKSLGIPPSSGAREATGGSEGHTVESGPDCPCQTLTGVVSYEIGRAHV